MPDFNSLLWTTRLAALAIVLQTIELLLLRRTYANNGIWRWSALAPEFSGFPRPLRKLFEFLFKEPNFYLLLLARMVAASFLFFISTPLLLLFLLFSTIATSVRWRGTFNGGSDYMTIVILSALTVAATFPSNPSVFLGCNLYVVAQLVLSYLISGLVKLRSQDWQNGSALTAFTASAMFAPPTVLRPILENERQAKILGWSIIAFECLFPLCFINVEFCLVFIAIGTLFHLGNSYVMGLNRFFFAWIATYPMLYWVAGLP